MMKSYFDKVDKQANLNYAEHRDKYLPSHDNMTPAEEDEEFRE